MNTSFTLPLDVLHKD